MVHVNDILSTSRQTNKINDTANFLKEHFQLKDLGILSHYLGMEIRKNKEGFYCVKQEKYIEKVLHRFGLQDAKPPLDQK